MLLLSDLHDEGNGIVLITHDQDVALAAARRVHIVDGRIDFDSKEASK